MTEMHETGPAGAPAAKSTRFGRKTLIATAAGLVLAAGVAASAALAQMGDGGEGWMGKKGMGHRIERMLDKVDATADQKTKIEGILKAAFEKRASMHEVGRQTRQEMVKLLSAPTIDRAAIETLRAQRIAMMDEMSKTMTTALADAAEVLTPDQRKEIAEMMVRHADRHGKDEMGMGMGMGHGGKQRGMMGDDDN